MGPTPFVYGPQLRGGGTAGFIKNKPGSQGILFRGGTELPDDRWPRGYTPERQAEVVDALGTDRTGPGVPAAIAGKDVEVAVADVFPDDPEWQYKDGLTEWSSRIPLPDPHPFAVAQAQPGSPNSIAKIRRMRAVGHKIVETVARSDTPVEELRRQAVPRAKTGADRRVRADADLYGQDVVQPPRFVVDEQRADELGATGYYDLHKGEPGRQSVGPIPWEEFKARAADPVTYYPTIGLRHRAGDETIIHELGHHRSGLEANRTSSLVGHQTGEPRYGTPAATGKEESFADMNVIERLRADPRSEPFNPKQFRNYPNRFGENTAKGKTFRKNYNRGRYGLPSTAPLPPDQYTPLSHDIGGPGRSFATPPSPYDNDDGPLDRSMAYTPERRLFTRIASRNEAAGTPDHGQYPLLDYSNQPLDTTKMGGGIPPDVADKRHGR